MATTPRTSFKDLLRSNLKWSYKRPAITENDGPFANSDDELERQLIHHWVLAKGYGGIVTAQIDDILKAPNARVLDIGCGGGVWTMEMAAAYPNATIVGVDKDSYAVPNSTMPSNVEFELADVVKEKLSFQDDSFDFVFVRDMNTSFDNDQWKLLLNEIRRVLKPDGLCEISDASYNTYPQSAPYIKQWSDDLHKAFEDRNINIHFMEALGEQISTYGPWTTVSSRTIQVPLGSHGGEWGQLMNQDMAQMVQPTLRFGGITDEVKLQEHAKNIFREIEENEFFVSFTSIVMRKNQA